ncbi:MAG TPA: IS1182 family transposase [Streptosporangiaceae bacterium]|nr:IS1182 family transposase [Streptosporangiaceae bacterium]
MQGFERVDRQLLDTEALAGHLVPRDSMFAFLAAHRAEVFPDGDYADLFAPPGFGRPSVPATRMAAVMTLQTLHDFSDRETAEAVRFDVRWKVACGLALDDAGFDPSTLVYWRRRIARSGRPHRVNDAVRKVVEQTGILKGRRRRAVDSTILADSVATQDTVTQLVSAIRRVAREVPGAAEQIAEVCTGHDYSVPGKPKIDWDDPAAKDALVSALVNDATALVDAFKDAKLDEQAASALALLALVAGQDVEPAEGSDGTDGRWRIARKVAEDRVISTVDPDARHTRKSPEARRDGYRAHLAADPETGIITDEQLTQASGTENSDPAVAEGFLAAEAGQDEAGPEVAGQSPAAGQDDNRGTEPEALAWYGDSAYGTGDLRGAICDAGHRAVIKPKPLQSPVEGGFTIDDFAVDELAGTVTCPAGHTVTLSRTRIATFGVACRDCPLRQRCTTCKTGRRLVLHERDDLLRAARADWAADTGLREDYMTHRPNVERAVAQVATFRGRRVKLRYRGVARNHAWLKRRTAAVNLRNLLGKGLTRRDGGWVLPT